MIYKIKKMKQILDWERITNEITHTWIKDYFEIEEDDEAGFDWVSDDIGGVFQFADYFFNFQNVLDCYKHDISREQLFSWYEFCLEKEVINISLAKFILNPAEKAKKEKEYLEELRQRVAIAKEEFNKAMEEYENKNI